jgi:hypothetical protein
LTTDMRYLAVRSCLDGLRRHGRGHVGRRRVRLVRPRPRRISRAPPAPQADDPSHRALFLDCFECRPRLHCELNVDFVPPEVRARSVNARPPTCSSWTAGHGRRPACPRTGQGARVSNDFKGQDRLLTLTTPHRAS